MRSNRYTLYVDVSSDDPHVRKTATELSLCLKSEPMPLKHLLLNTGNVHPFALIKEDSLTEETLKGTHVITVPNTPEALEILEALQGGRIVIASKHPTEDWTWHRAHLVFMLSILADI